ncbi:LETM1 domain-containing protein [Fluviicola sp.]|uniref:LETM1 domain-containing protein n=1 Tax=Fluviicola sp. TaxID=1917219 RepID=UPI0026244E8D|nr:LETM1 domain-containing protein [Fluviicola sp.]
MNVEVYLEEHAHHFLLGVKTEYNGDKEAAGIIQKYIREGKISDEEEHVLKTQLADSLKIVGIGVPFALIPGASILMPILIKVADKHHIQLMPSAFIDPENQ